MTCLATIPPDSGNYFADAVYENATLYVPMRSLERYMNAEGWSRFQHIEGIDTGDEPSLPGDVNRDELVDINDVTLLISVILGNNTDEYDTVAADINEDNMIDINDVTLLISMVLTGHAN